MKKSPVVVCSLFAAMFALGADQAAVRVEPADSVGPRALEKQTETAVIRDYLQAWSSLSNAFEQNRVDLLDRDFTGTAREKLAGTISKRSLGFIHAIETVRTIFSWFFTRRKGFRSSWSTRLNTTYKFWMEKRLRPCSTCERATLRF